MTELLGMQEGCLKSVPAVFSFVSNSHDYICFGFVYLIAQRHFCQRSISFEITPDRHIKA